MAYTIVCFGDSNTHGFDPISFSRLPYIARWPGILAHLLGPDYHIQEAGLSGRTTVFDDPLTEGLCGLHAITPCLMSHEPVDLLIIMLGTNDTKIRFHATSENIATGMKRLIQKAQSTACWRDDLPRILLVAPPMINPSYLSGPFSQEMGPDCHIKSESLASLYAPIAQTLGIDFVNAEDFVQVDLSDGMHLNAQGHQKLALSLSAVIKNIEKKRATL